MNVIDALSSRYSCRAFKPDPVDKETILKIVDTAVRAPSWSNTQPWEVYVASGKPLEKLRKASLENFRKGVERNPDAAIPKTWPDALQKRVEELASYRLRALGVDREDKAGRARLAEQNYAFFNAPAVLYLCMDRTLTPWSMFDLGAFAQSIMVTALEYGLASIPAVVLTAYPGPIRAELKIPEMLSIVIGIAVGYGDPQHPQNQIRSRRRSAADVVTFR